LIVDYHMHLRGPDESIDHTVGAVERFVDAATARGIDEIGFSEHIYYFQETRLLWTVPYHVERCRYSLDSYVDAVVGAKRQGMPVKLGLEVDFVAGREEETERILEPYPWAASDAHVPQNLGRDLDRAVEHARAAGYETVTVFDQRSVRQEPLGW
jgi:histidinol-phosphatase (PHP family)